MDDILSRLVVLLAQARVAVERRSRLIREFQRLVWEGLPRGIPEDVRRVLQDLAYDLDYFEPDPERRKEDPTYYGNERLERLIDEATARLEALGVAVTQLSGS